MCTELLMDSCCHFVNYRSISGVRGARLQVKVITKFFVDKTLLSFLGGFHGMPFKANRAIAFPNVFDSSVDLFCEVGQKVKFETNVFG